MRITRLGQGVDATGPARPRRHRAHGRRAARVPRRHGRPRRASGCGSTATSAARDAANRDDFFAAAEAVVGAAPELLSGDEEGRCRFAGATAELDPPTDRSSSSTSAAGRPSSSSAPTDVEEVRSLDIGCVRLTEKYLAARPARARGAVQRASSVATSYLDDVVRELPGGADGPDASSGWPARSPPWPRSRSAWPSTTATHPPLPPHPRRGRGRVPHAGHRVARGPAPQPRPRGGAGRRDRRRLLRAGGDHAAAGDRGVLVSESDILDGLIASLEP